MKLILCCQTDVSFEGPLFGHVFNYLKWQISWAGPRRLLHQIPSGRIPALNNQGRPVPGGDPLGGGVSGQAPVVIGIGGNFFGAPPAGLETTHYFPLLQFRLVDQTMDGWGGNADQCRS